MNSVFKNDSQYEKFESALFSWLGSPYKHFTMVKGRGADCVLFMMACLHEAGILSHVDNSKYYSRDWWRHGGGEVIRTQFVDHIDKYGIDCHSVWFDKEDELQRGDLLGFSMSPTKITHHCAVLLNNKKEMIHSINHRGVVTTPFSPWWRRHVTGFARILKGNN